MHSKEAAGFFALRGVSVEKAGVLTSKSTFFFQTDQFMSPLKNVTSGHQFLSVIHVTAHKLNLMKQTQFLILSFITM